MTETFATGEWVCCLKCGSKFLLRVLEAKGRHDCPMCSEPGLRYWDPAQPNADLLNALPWPPQ
jgi:hypothetical protein